ncbi:MAG TPA: dihydrolipoamide acetyltransferase family protein [Candidatus Limnocylindrales bacterium]|nr:dihydrolipoamide acetyltransferase family protein [Candidatus Limnocylindrales bacterium]
MPKVQMPQLGESVAEGTIGKWLKKPGDHVDKYEPIVEVITDKVNAEVPSPYEGTLTEILVQEGETVPNNTEIAVIEGANEAAEATGAGASAAAAAAPEAPGVVATAEAMADETAPQAGTGPAGSNESPGRSVEQPTAELTQATQATPPAAPAAQTPMPMTSAATAVAAPAISGGNGAAGPNGYKGPTTPAVRRLAREHGIELSMIAGSGHSGRVTREDVLKFVESGGAQATPSAQGAAPTQPAATAPAQQGSSGSAPAVASAAQASSPVAQGDSLKQPSPMRKAIAAQMSKALAVPVAYTVIEIDMSGVVSLRDRTKGQYQAQEGISLTFDAFVAKATVEALKKHADFNAHYTDEGHWLRKSVNLGVAVAVEDGLVVPVIQNADTLSIHGLNKAIRDLAERSRGQKLRMEDIQGGTFTLDNTGWTGSIITQPIINAPEVGIMTMESIVKRPVVISGPNGDAIGIRPMMYVTLGFDHRATDGAQAGRFVADVKSWLEAVDSNTAIW